MTEAEIIQHARDITGNKASVVAGEAMVPDEAVQAALSPVVRALNKLRGTASALKERAFTAVRHKQDYPLADVLGNDVAAVKSVIRSGAHVPDALAGDDGEVGVDGLPTGRGAGTIDPGLQGDVFAVIIGQRRRRRESMFSFEVIDGRLRLFPRPASAELVVVRYVTTARSVETLDEEAEAALVWAACVAVIDAQINRFMSDRATANVTGTAAEAATRRMQMLEKQREKYEQRFAAEMQRLQG